MEMTKHMLKLTKHKVFFQLVNILITIGNVSPIAPPLFIAGKPFVPLEAIVSSFTAIATLPPSGPSG
jgi:hypothetical protein